MTDAKDAEIERLKKCLRWQDELIEKLAGALENYRCPGNAQCPRAKDNTCLREACGDYCGSLANEVLAAYAKHKEQNQ